MRWLLPTASLCLLAGCLTPVEGNAWAANQTQITELAALGLTGKGIRVAIIDTGIDVQHPALRHLADGKAANGELVGFRDFVPGSGNPVDQDGHGTFVAGLLVGRDIEGPGIWGGQQQGLVTGVELLVGRICADHCVASLLPKAIDWALDQDADIISISMGVPSEADDVPPATWMLLGEALARADRVGVLVVASAGNIGPGGHANARDVMAPAVHPRVIAVGGMARNGEVLESSARAMDGELRCQAARADPCTPYEKPDLIAPGEDIWSTWAHGDGAMLDGTSAAAVFVTAVLALILEAHGEPVGQGGSRLLRQALHETAAKRAGQDWPHDLAAGYGLVQGASALRWFESASS